MLLMRCQLLPLVPRRDSLAEMTAAEKPRNKVPNRDDFGAWAGSRKTTV
jgi:hypothetical protein